MWSSSPELTQLLLLSGVVLSSSCLGLLFLWRSLFHPWEREHGHAHTFTMVSPTRLFWMSCAPLLITAYGRLRGSLSRSGAVAAIFVGMALSLAQLAFFGALLGFFLPSSKVTKFRQAEKRRIEGSAFRENGQRNWKQVLCNGGVAFICALLYLLDVGSADLPVDFARHYRASWLGTALLGALGCCAGDTFASEIGSVFGGGSPRLVTTLRRVPRGTNGAVSIVGLLVSVVGGMFVGLGYYLGVLLATPSVVYQRTPANQAYLVLLGGLAGLIGSGIDSLLGATCQYSGLDEKTGAIVEVPGPGVKHISGRTIFSNHGVNLLSSLITALILPEIAVMYFNIY